MAALAEAFVRIRPDTSTFEADAKKGVGAAAPALGREGQKLGKSVMAGAEKETRKGGRAFVSVGQRMGSGLRSGMLLPLGGISKAFVGAFAAIGAAKVFSGFIADAQESARIGRVTEQVIRSTGGAAKVTADQVGALATAISNKTGADDEAVQSGQNLLLTFTNIRNGVGANNDIFNQASQAIVDMTAAMNNGEVSTEGIKTSSIQLGKALNDPIRGITALRKVGVSFTDQQTKQIKTLVASGHTMDAQKIILKELGKEFGGAAAAAADPITRLKVILGNLGESIGGLLLPIIGKFANLLGDVVVPAVYDIGNAFRLVLGDDGAAGFAEVMDHAFGNTGKLIPVFQAVGQVIRQVAFGFQALVAAFKEGDVTSTGFIGVMERVGVALRGFANFVTGTVVPAIGRFLQAAGPVVARVFQAFAGFIVQRVVPALRQFGGFIVGTVVPAVVRLWGFLAKNLGPTFVALGQFITQRVFPALRGLFVRFQQVAPTVGRVIAFVAKLVGILLGLVVVILGKVLPVIIKLAGPIFSLLFAAIGKIIGIAAALARAFIAATGTVIRVFLAMVGAILNGAAKAFGWVPGIGGKLKTAAKAFETFRNQVNDALGGVKSRKVSVTAELSAGPGGGRNIGFAAGGPVYGPGTATSDSIHAMLSRGEHVLTAREVKGFGGHEAVARMRKIAAARAPGFAAGGPVEFDVAPQLSGLDKFKRGLEEFNRAVDAKVRKMWAESGGSGVFTPGSGNYGPANLRGNAANTQAAINFIRSRFGLTSGGWRAVGSVANSDHPRGKALDTMIPNYLSPRGIALGNAVAAYFMGNPKAFGTKYVIWRGRISEGSGWHPYFRGNRAVYGDTLAHYDHVHTSLFDRGGFLPPRSATLAINRTNRAESVTTGATMDAVIGELRGLRKDLKRLPVAQVDERYVRRQNRYLNGRDPSGW